MNGDTAMKIRIKWVIEREIPVDIENYKTGALTADILHEEKDNFAYTLDFNYEDTKRTNTITLLDDHGIPMGETHWEE